MSHKECQLDCRHLCPDALPTETGRNLTKFNFTVNHYFVKIRLLLQSHIAIQWNITMGQAIFVPSLEIVPVLEFK